LGIPKGKGWLAGDRGFKEYWQAGENPNGEGFRPQKKGGKKFSGEGEFQKIFGGKLLGKF